MCVIFLFQKRVRFYLFSETRANVLRHARNKRLLLSKSLALEIEKKCFVLFVISSWRKLEDQVIRGVQYQSVRYILITENAQSSKVSRCFCWNEYTYNVTCLSSSNFRDMRTFLSDFSECLRHYSAIGPSSDELKSKGSIATAITCTVSTTLSTSVKRLVTVDDRVSLLTPLITDWGKECVNYF